MARARGGAGGGGGGGGSGDANASASGDGSGQAAQDDSTGAGACGPGTTGSCTNCGTSVTAGDPVDVATGRVTLQVEDLALPGLLNFSFSRTYTSTGQRRDVGLGWGWSHTLAWELVERRDHLEVWDADGTKLQFAKLDPGEETRGPRGWKLRRTVGGWQLDTGGVRLVFEGTVDGRTPLARIEDRHGNVIRIERDAA